MSGPVPDLLPCPFCGGEAHAPKAIGGHSSAFRIVQCSRSDSCGSVAGSTDDEAIAAWNTRTDPERDALKARVEALVSAADHYAQNYLLDEYHSPDLCMDDAHREAVAGLFEALSLAKGEQP